MDKIIEIAEPSLRGILYGSHSIGIPLSYDLEEPERLENNKRTHKSKARNKNNYNCIDYMKNTNISLEKRFT